VLIADQPKNAVDYFQGQLAEHRTTENIYGDALALSMISRNNEALEVLKPLFAADPTQVNIGLLQANLLTSLNRNAEAQAVYRRVLDANSQSAAAVLEYADSLIQTGHPLEARQLLLNHQELTEAENVTRMSSDRLLSQAAASVGYTAEAQYQAANYLFHRGAGREAIEQLDSALRLETLKPDDRARLLARRREIIATLPKSQLVGRS
jgi:predicted Zn-dependent protease